MRVRLTIRGLMIAVALVALILALALFFWRSEDLEDNLVIRVINQTSIILDDLNYDFKGPGSSGGGTTTETVAPGRIYTMAVEWSGPGTFIFYCRTPNGKVKSGPVSINIWSRRYPSSLTFYIQETGVKAVIASPELFPPRNQ
jgi:nitrogen fixation-related uncharacterized protein